MGARSKDDEEVAVFSSFAEAAKLSLDLRTVKKRQPPEPDIRAWLESEGPVAYELTELCDPDLARLIAKPEEAHGAFLWTADPSSRIVKKKLLMQYQTDCPVELLCYTNGPIVTPDDVLIPTLRSLLECRSGCFRRAWLFGETGAHEIWSAC